MMRILFVLLAAASVCAAQETFAGSADIDAVIDQAIAADQMPGAVVWIGREGRILHRKAYGNRALVPRKEAMTLDTIFDAASLTKVVTTTASIMKLVEQGKLRLNDPVSLHLAGYQVNGSGRNGNGAARSAITIRHLLTHFSGLRPDVDLEPAWSGYETGIRKAMVDKPVAAPGERFIYSDINFVLLGEIVHRLSGKPLDTFARENIFDPTGMKETFFNPPAMLRERIAPTELYPGMAEPLRGVVHDPTARYMGGIAGHAGMFTTAGDLAKFAQMMLNLGDAGGVRVLSPLTIRKFTEPQTPPDSITLRGFGFDMDSQFSANRGELFPIGSYGHTGFTGTSLWMDPVTRTYVIVMSNSVHPARRPPITAVRAKVATVTAAALGIDAQKVALTGYNETVTGPAARRNINRNGGTLSGIDVLAAARFSQLNGKRVALITNHTGLTRAGKRNIDVLVAGGVNLKAILSPEHGITGTEDHENVGDSKDAATGVPIISLYKGKNRSPNEELLRSVDVLVFDIQDVGARFYTYTCTLLNALEAASRTGTAVMVLDRPNPVTGVRVEGPGLDKQLESFIGCWPMPVRHGMTMGELARMFHDERKYTNRLEIVAMKNWQRGDWLDSTGLYWVDPSPNMRSLNAATLYTGIALLEFSTNYSVGRGTDAPFEQVGAPWINGPELAAKLNARAIPGVRAYATRFTPKESVLKGQLCNGVRFVIVDRERFESVRFGLELAVMLEKLYPGQMIFDKSAKLIGSQKVVDAIKKQTDPRAIETSYEDDLRIFLGIRNKYLLYR